MPVARVQGRLFLGHAPRRTNSAVQLFFEFGELCQAPLEAFLFSVAYARWILHLPSVGDQYS